MKKATILVSHQDRHKPDCTATEAGLEHKISNLEKKRHCSLNGVKRKGTDHLCSRTVQMISTFTLPIHLFSYVVAHLKFEDKFCSKSLYHCSCTRACSGHMEHVRRKTSCTYTHLRSQIVRFPFKIGRMINPYLTNGFAHSYHLGQSTFIIRDIRSDYEFYSLFR